MRKFNRLMAFTFTLILSILASGGRAQDNFGLSFAASQDGQLTLFGLGDTPLVVNNPANHGFYSITWSPDGNKLAYIMNDEQFQAHLMALDVTTGTDPVMLDSGALVSGFPVTFAPDGNIIYIGQTALPTDASQPYRVDVKRIAPEGDAQPETLASFDFMVGCGGGASIPADWQYWGETGFGGNALTLRLTDFGVLHSTICSGGGLGLLNLETGEDTKIGPELVMENEQPTEGPLGRVDLSPDGKTAAAVRTHFVGDNPQSPFTYSLSLIDLATLAVTDVETAAEPERLAWNNDGTSLFYSSRVITGSLADGLSQEAQDKLGPVVGYNPDGTLLNVPVYQVTIHQLNPTTGEDNTVYTADAFAIGRMAATPDGQHLFASQVAGLDNWVAGIVDGTFDPANNTDGTGARALVPVTLYRIPLITREAPILIGENLSQFALRPSRQ